mmetsp:Transcript_2392/g.2675  ORF Transcript_2392/g.2675 Transcript_2392/m.2675 type:complete len:274 (+) Transcript_2392:25-846(+)
MSCGGVPIAYSSRINSSTAPPRGQSNLYNKVVINLSARESVWMKKTGALSLLKKNPAVFTYYNTLALPDNIDTKIRNDIHRTFHHFNKTKQEGLYQVLRAYAHFNPDVGYCQGMNFIAGVILENLPPEKCFWVFLQFMRKLGLASLFMPGLPGLEEKLRAFKIVQGRFLPKLLEHFEGLGLEGLVFANKWFLTLFGCKYDIVTLTKFFDAFLVFGWNSMYALSLAILQHKQTELLQCDNIGDAFVLLETAPSELPFIKITTLASTFLANMEPN